MLTYNTHLTPLILPEYGRNIQNMVEYCKTIEDRDERNVCARSIIRSMGNLFPELRDTPDATHKLWDHLAIMANFELDIDYPYGEPMKDQLETRPNQVPYGAHGRELRYRHYGMTIQKMIDKASAMEESEQRNELIRLIANHMKKALLAINKDGVEDIRVFNDLRDMSHGSININPETMRLHEFRLAPQVVQQNNKKKKKKNHNQGMNF